MAPGILSEAAFDEGYLTFSDALLALAGAVYIVLLAVLLIRIARFGRHVLADLRSPARAAGFFAAVAAPDVLAARLYATGLHPTGTLVCWSIGLAFWLVAIYAVPIALVRGRTEPLFANARGAWLLVAVATASLAVAGADVAQRHETHALLVLSLMWWGLAIALYLPLALVFLARVARARLDSAAYGPASWLLMGALAISVLAGTELLAFSGLSPVILRAHSFLEGVSLVLWGIGMLWIPPVIAGDLWRWRRRPSTWGYEGDRWATVFPLGMFAAASRDLGLRAGLPAFGTIAEVFLWAGVAVAALAAVGLARRLGALAPPGRRARA
jgi:tellurite resistance protein TehA-like permease